MNVSGSALSCQVGPILLVQRWTLQPLEPLQPASRKRECWPHGKQFSVSSSGRSDGTSLPRTSICSLCSCRAGWDVFWLQECGFCYFERREEWPLLSATEVNVETSRYTKQVREVIILPVSDLFDLHSKSHTFGSACETLPDSGLLSLPTLPLHTHLLATPWAAPSFFYAPKF